MSVRERLAEGSHVLVTGGAGFIGSHLAEALLGRGCRVSVLDDLSTGCEENVAHLAKRTEFRLVIDSVTRDGVLDRLMAECDLVVHLAAAVGVELILSDPVHVLECNILGVQRVLESAHRYRRRVLLASSSEIYGKSERVPFGEEDDRLLGPTTHARWSYSTSKAVGEYLGLAYHRQMGLPVVVFRLFNTIGPRQTGRYGMVVPRFVDQALSGEPLTVYGDGSQSRSFCDVEDTVHAIIGLAEAPQARGEVVNIGSTDEISILELSRRTLEVVERCGFRPQRREAKGIVLVPYEQAYEPGFEDMRRRVPELAKHRRLTGWAPRVTLDESLERIVLDLSRRRGLREAPGDSAEKRASGGAPRPS